MSTHDSNSHAERDEDGPMILAHDEVAGYRPVFYACITLGMLYLAFVFWQSW